MLSQGADRLEVALLRAGRMNDLRRAQVVVECVELEAVEEALSLRLLLRGGAAEPVVEVRLVRASSDRGAPRCPPEQGVF